MQTAAPTEVSAGRDGCAVVCDKCASITADPSVIADERLGAARQVDRRAEQSRWQIGRRFCHAERNARRDEQLVPRG